MADNTIKLIVKAIDDASDEIRKIKSEMALLGDSATNSDKKMAKFGITVETLKGAYNAVSAALKPVIDFTRQAIDETVSYNKTVREMTQVTGLGAEEISRIIQVGDDWGVSIDAIRTALAFMNKSGVTPSIENLAILADQYKRSSDKALWAEGAVKTLGRGYQTLIPLLALGGDGIREATAAIEDSLIVTDESIRKTREYEVAVDDLTDAWQGVKYQVGTAVIPALTDLAGQINSVLDSLNNENSELAEYDKWLKLGMIDVEKVNAREKELNETMIHSEAHAQAQNEATAAAIALWNELYSAEDKLNYARQSTVTTTDAATVSLNYYNDAVGTYSDRSPLFLQQWNEFAAAADTAAFNTDKANAAIDIIDGTIKDYGDTLVEHLKIQAAFNLALGLITQEQYDYQVSIANSLAPLEQMALLVQQGELDISYLQQAMADGEVTAQELEDAYIATGMGAEEARLKVLGLLDAINSVPERKQINFDIVVTGDQVPGNQPGGPGQPAPVAKHAGANFVVPPGYPNDSYPMNVESGEHVIVVPRGGNTNNTNFTMNVHTNAPYATLLADYYKLKAMAG